MMTIKMYKKQKFIKLRDYKEQSDFIHILKRNSLINVILLALGFVI